MNLPNKLTLTRILLVPVFMIFVSLGQYITPSYNPRYYLIAGLIFAAASFTDFLDGPYPFMRVYDQTIQETLMWFTIILLTNLLYAFLLWWLGGNGRKSKVGLEFRT